MARAFYDYRAVFDPAKEAWAVLKICYWDNAQSTHPMTSYVLQDNMSYVDAVTLCGHVHRSLELSRGKE